jgi:glycerol uptake facilitator-like aquaporin
MSHLHDDLPVEQCKLTNVSLLLPGTFLFLLFAFGGTQAAKVNWDYAAPNPAHNPTKAVASPDLLLYIAVAFGLSLTVNVFVFYRVSGGLFNPAITTGLVVIGAMSPLKGALLGASQLLGGIAASAVVAGLLPGGLAVGTALARKYSQDPRESHIREVGGDRVLTVFGVWCLCSGSFNCAGFVSGNVLDCGTHDYDLPCTKSLL